MTTCHISLHIGSSSLPISCAGASIQKHAHSIYSYLKLPKDAAVYGHSEPVIQMGLRGRGFGSLPRLGRRHCTPASNVL